MTECVPHTDSIIGALTGRAKLDNHSFTSDAANLGLNYREKLGYERAMAFEMSKGPKPYEVFDARQKGLKEKFDAKRSDTYRKALNRATWQTASEYFGDRFYNALSKKIRGIHEEAMLVEGQLLKEGKEAPSAMARWRKTMNPFLDGIDNEITRLGQKYEGAALDQALQKNYGIGAHQVYEALSYIRWLKEAPMYSGDRGLISDAIRNTSSFVGTNSVAWTILNAGDATRIIAPYLTKPKVLMQGLKEAFVSDGGIFNPVAALEASDMPGSAARNMDIFSVSNRMQERIAYFLDKADGGDGRTGVRNNAFQRDAWDVSGLERHDRLGRTGREAVMGLGRFLLAETNWNIKNYYNLAKYVGTLGKAGSGRQVANYMAYTAIKSAMFGSKAAVPAFIWSAMVPKDSELNKPMGLVNDLANTIVQATGIDAEVDLADVMQPLGLIFGAKGAQITGGIEGAVRFAGKTAKGVSEGDLDATASAAAVAGLSMLSVFGLPKEVMAYKDWIYLGANMTTMRAMKAWQETAEKNEDAAFFVKTLLKKELPGMVKASDSGGYGSY